MTTRTSFTAIPRKESVIAMRPDTYDGAPTYSVSIMELSDNLATHETQYFADAFPAPASRAALAESIPARDR